MLCRNASWAVRFVCICVLMTALSGHPAGNVTETPKVAVRRSHSLSPGEQEFILKRKLIVLEALDKLGINSTLDTVPHIAVLGSGGGQRSAVALIGSLHQMKADGLLDTLLYLGGVSGSTWAISTLYSDPEWSSNMNQSLSRLSGPKVEVEEIVDWLRKRAEEDDFSLTDLWGVMTGAGLMKQMDLRNLSDEATRPNATNPYPIYNAIEKKCYDENITEATWFELTPHESGFIELGLFVNTSALNTGLAGGMNIMDMVRMNVFVKTFLTDDFSPIDMVLNWQDEALPMKRNIVLDNLMDSMYVLNNYMRVYHSAVVLLDVMKRNTKDPYILANITSLHSALKGKLELNPWPTLILRNQKEKEQILMDWSQELIKPVDRWSQSLEEGTFKEFATFVTKNVLPRLGNWDWGTSNNFLYNINYTDLALPPCLTSYKQLNLIDSGVMVNSPFPPLLGDRRDIDVMITPDYSAGTIFEILRHARDYAVQLNKPFPELDESVLEEKDWPNDCYVFEGKDDEPTIIYMPLFNRKNCKDENDMKRLRKLYSTFSLPFNKNKIEVLLNIARTNFENNRETILREIGKAAQRRLQRSCG